MRATGRATEVIDSINKKSADLLIKSDEKIQQAIHHRINLAQKLVEERLKSAYTIKDITEKMGNEVLVNQQKHDVDMVALKVQVEIKSNNVNCLQTHLSQCQKRNKELKATIKRGASKNNYKTNNNYKANISRLSALKRARDAETELVNERLVSKRRLEDKHATMNQLVLAKESLTMQHEASCKILNQLAIVKTEQNLSFDKVKGTQGGG